MAESRKITECHLRRAQLEDVDLLYEWVSDRAVRQSAFDSHDISYEEHVKWFDRMMRDPGQVQYILMVDDIPVGQIRFTISGDNAEIDYSIASSFRRAGYGSRILRLAQKRIKEDTSSVRRLTAKVKPINTASLHCFEACGFSECYRQPDRYIELELQIE